jgi:NAD(P) transhydrogenase subunit alpha
MIIGSPREIFKGENRVALTPESAKQLQKLGYICLLETGAGINANFSDKDYKNAGVKIVKNSNELWKQSNIIIKVRGPEKS